MRERNCQSINQSINPSINHPALPNCFKGSAELLFDWCSSFFPLQALTNQWRGRGYTSRSRFRTASQTWSSLRSFNRVLLHFSLSLGACQRVRCAVAQPRGRSQRNSEIRGAHVSIGGQGSLFVASQLESTWDDCGRGMTRARTRARASIIPITIRPQTAEDNPSSDKCRSVSSPSFTPALRGLSVRINSSDHGAHQDSRGGSH